MVKVCLAPGGRPQRHGGSSGVGRKSGAASPRPGTRRMRGGPSPPLLSPPPCIAERQDAFETVIKGGEAGGVGGGVGGGRAEGRGLAAPDLLGWVRWRHAAGVARALGSASACGAARLVFQWLSGKVSRTEPAVAVQSHFA